MKFIRVAAFMMLTHAAAAAPAAPDEAGLSLQDASDVQIQEALDAAAGEQGGVTSTADAVPDDALLELSEAQAQALQGNPSLHAAVARIEQARQRVVQARSLYFPQVSAAFSAVHTELPNNSVEAVRQESLDAALGSLRQSLTSFFSGGLANVDVLRVLQTGQQFGNALAARDGIDERVDTYDLSLTATYLLFDGYERRFNVAIARYGAEETEAAYLESQRLLLEAVATAYYGVQLARENIAIARADEEFNQRLLRDAQARRRVGTGALSDVLNFEVRVRAAQAAVLEGQRNYELSRIALATLIGLEDAQLGEGVELSALDAESAEEMLLPEEEPLVSRARSSRPDVLRAKFALERAGATVGARRSGYFPDVGAFAGRSASRVNSGRFDEEDFNTSVGVTVNYDLFTGGRTRAAVREARYFRMEAEHLLEEAELLAAADVREALVNLRIAQEQLILQRTTAEYVQRQRDLVEREFEVGQGALALLNQAQRDLIESQARLALARVSLRQAWHTLRTATAETLSVVEASEGRLQHF